MKTYFNVFKNVYVDLDAILDTRLGTLFTLDENLYNFYKTDGRELYVNRLIDEFGYIPSKVFKYYYNKRDKTILKYSLLTPLLDILNISIEDMITKRVSADKSVKKIIIDVNVHPYKLTDKEKEKIKLSIVAKLKNEFVNINIIDMNYEQLTTKNCEQYGIMAMYDAMEWLNIRGLLKDIDINIPNTHLMLPYLLPKPTIFKSGETIEKYFKQLEELFSYYIKLEFNRAELFSFIK